MRHQQVVPRDEYKTKLQFYRLQKGITQAELAKLAGIPFRTLQDYEQGQKNINNAKAIVVWQVAEALGISIYDLLEFDKEV